MQVAHRLKSYNSGAKGGRMMQLDRRREDLLAEAIGRAAGIADPERWTLSRTGGLVRKGRDLVLTDGFRVLVEGTSDGFIAWREAGTWMAQPPYRFTVDDALRMCHVPPKAALKLASQARLALAGAGE